MKQKDKTAQQRGTPQITKINLIAQSIRNTTKVEQMGDGPMENIAFIREVTKPKLVGIYLMENDPQGISALSGLSALHDLNPRNSISELRRDYGIRILDEFFSHRHSGDETVKMKRYWLADSCQARKVAALVNLKSKQHGATPLSRNQMASYLTASPLPKTLNSGCQSVE